MYFSFYNSPIAQKFRYALRIPRAILRYWIGRQTCPSVTKSLDEINADTLVILDPERKELPAGTIPTHLGEQTLESLEERLSNCSSVGAKYFESALAVHQIELKPLQDVTARSDGGWQVTGNDPQFSLHSSQNRLPGGHVLVSFNWRAAKFSFPKLYFDCGYGVVEAEAVDLCGVRQGRSLTLVSLPTAVQWLRFDPTDETGVCEINNFSIIELRFLTPDTQRSIIKGIYLLNPNYNLYLKCLQRQESQQVSYQSLVSIELQENIRKHKSVRNTIQNWNSCPSISVLMPVHNPQIHWLESAIESVLNQSYPHWQLWHRR